MTDSVLSGPIPIIIVLANGNFIPFSPLLKFPVRVKVQSSWPAQPPQFLGRTRARSDLNLDFIPIPQLKRRGCNLYTSYYWLHLLYTSKTS